LITDPNEERDGDEEGSIDNNSLEAREKRMGDNEKCPECASKCLTRDETRGEVVCDDCGIIIEENEIDLRAERRVFSPEHGDEQSNSTFNIEVCRHSDDWWGIKSKYSNAMGIAISKLDPPYTGFGDAADINPKVRKDLGELAKIGVLEKEYKIGDDKESDKYDKRNWFEILGTDIIEMEEMRKKTSSNFPTLRQILFHISYLHKSSELRHIEPIWMFSEHLGIGKREVKRGYEHWPEDQPIFSSNYIARINEIIPGYSTIESIISIAEGHGKFKLSADEKKEITKISANILSELRGIKFEGGNDLLSLCMNKANYSSNYRFHNPYQIIGLIEALIINYVIKNNNELNISQQVVNDFSETLFPKFGSAGAYWRIAISEGALAMADTWKKLLVIAGLVNE
jgi:hypothetical protein